MTIFTLIKAYSRKILQTLFFLFLANILSLALPWGIKIIVDDVLINKKSDKLVTVILVLVILFVFKSLFMFLYKMMSSMIGEKIVCDLRERLYHQALRLPLLDVKSINPSQIVARMTGDIQSVRRFIFGSLIDFIYAFLNIGFILAILFYLNPLLAGMSLIFFPLFAFLYLRFYPSLKKGYRCLRDINGKLFSRMNEVLQGLATVRIFTAEGNEMKRFEEQQKSLLCQSRYNHRVSVGLATSVEFFSTLTVLGLFWVGGTAVIRQEMTVGELVAFYSYLGMLFSPVIRLMVMNSSFQESAAALQRINEVFGEDKKEIIFSQKEKLQRLKGSVEFRNVSFSYTPGRDVLKDVSFLVRPGETIGLVGVSGAGKTTLVHLLAGLMFPRQGDIFLDGQNLRGLDASSYRRFLSAVMQDDHLFSGTVLDNICYGKTEASKEDVFAAARVAHVHNFILSLPLGYETQVGERGVQLSSGQRQRLAIARAVLRCPEILVLDEATSSVDALTENAIQRSLRDRFHGKTVFIIAHRFSSVMEADKIFVLDKGRLVEAGDHETLLEKKGLYATLYFEQFKEGSLPEENKSSVRK